MATLLDGKGLAKKVREALADRVSEIQASLGRAPGLSVILVGEDPASAVYVRNKERAATAMGLKSEIIHLPADSTQEQVLAEVERLNNDPSVDGFMVQLPLPSGLDENAITQAIAPEKDADGLHPTNLGRLLAGMDAPRPCTPFGVMELLREGGVELEGRHAVVIGRSTIVGKPQALLLLEKNATVTICHSRTQNLADEVRRADVVVAAVGRPHFVQGDWVKPGAAVVDVGINRVDGKLVGDVDFDAVQGHAGWITPVPGGVGPMTVAMLMKNAVDAAAKKIP
ncbi:MAG: bifunctional methylenetetrahydrofolate dehydrogenase/methenyltetrahydrofolate cyclohydrolase FolD [Myxococcota bacterium]|nr:bifunctional methylenetetrahydrofolate dehydrogenase/methenyltetrahydrofolate cyclohydrolase FolD [Myxococcota bacterium]